MPDQTPLTHHVTKILRLFKEVPEHNLEPLSYIGEMVNKTPYANITITMRIHDGMVTDITNQTFDKKRFPLEKNNLDKQEKM